MFCQYLKCDCPVHKTHPFRPLTEIILDYWQREYDCKPYRNFQINRMDFEKRMKRPFDLHLDWAVLLGGYLSARKFQSLRIAYISLPSENSLLEILSENLCTIESIQLVNVDMPEKFLFLLRDNCYRMNVKELNLKGNPLPKGYLFALRCFLIHSATLQRLNVADCKISELTFAILADGIYKSGSISAINCSRMIRMSGFSTVTDTTKTASLVSSLIWQNKLKEIILQNCDFTASDMEVICEYLAKKDSRLESLDLANNSMAADGVEYLFKAIAASGTLRKLSISGNSIGSHGGEVIAKLLSSCCRLQHLNISFNRIGCEAVNAILTTLKKPIPLTELFIYGNEFNEKTAQVLRRVIAAEILPPPNGFDVAVTFDEALYEYRVIPQKGIHLLRSEIH